MQPIIICVLFHVHIDRKILQQKPSSQLCFMCELFARFSGVKCSDTKL